MHTRTNWPPATPIAITATLTGVAVFTLLHFLLSDQVNPMRDPVSSYVLFQPGDGWFALGTLSLAVACAALAYGCLPGESGARGWLAGAVAALILVTVFQTETSDKMSAIAQIHRYSAGAVFALITVAAGAVWYPRRGTSIGRVLGFLALVATIAMIINAVNTLFPAIGGSITWRGVPQRVMLVTQAIVLLMIPYLPAPSRRTRGWHMRTETGSTSPQAKLPVTETGRLWLTGRGGREPGALLSANGLHTNTVCRQ